MRRAIDPQTNSMVFDENTFFSSAEDLSPVAVSPPPGHFHGNIITRLASIIAGFEGM